MTQPTGFTNAPGMRGLLLWSLLYLMVFAVFYPPISGIEDEVGFVNQALVWTKGAVSAEGAGVPPPHDFINSYGRHVPHRSPGRSLTIVPFFSLFGFSSIFWSGAAIHLALVFIFAALLYYFRISLLWAGLVLFHPTLLIYSRTVMADELGGLMVLAALLLILKKKNFGIAAGICLGFGILCRIHLAIMLPLFILGLILEKKADWKEIAKMCITASIFIIAGMVYNFIIYKLPFLPSVGLFKFRFLNEHLPAYALSLFLVWPAMIFVPLAKTLEFKWLFRSLLIPPFIFFTFYYYRDQGHGRLQDLILGQRLLLMFIPIWILGYVLILSNQIPARIEALDVRIKTIGFVIVTILFGGVTTYTFSSHQKHLIKYLAVREEVESVIPAGSLIIANSNITKIISVPAEGRKNYRMLNYSYHGKPVSHADTLSELKGEWYIALLPKRSGDELPEFLNQYISNYKLQKLTTKIDSLIIFRKPAENE